MSTNENVVEIRVKGQWFKVPSLEVNGAKLYVSGKRLKMPGSVARK